MRPAISIIVLALLLSMSLFGQNLSGAIHAYAAPIPAGSGASGYLAGVCMGGMVLGLPGALVYDFWDREDVQPFGQYSGNWTLLGPVTDWTLLSDKGFVETIRGELVGTWTPYVFKNGKWKLDKRNALANVSAWFSDSQLASSSKTPRHHDLGCGQLQVITGLAN